MLEPLHYIVRSGASAIVEHRELLDMLFDMCKTVCGVARVRRRLTEADV